MAAIIPGALPEPEIGLRSETEQYLRLEGSKSGLPCAGVYAQEELFLFRSVFVFCSKIGGNAHQALLQRVAHPGEDAGTGVT